MSFPNIEAERARSGMSKESLAEALGVSYRTYYNWEKRGALPSGALVKMSKLFKCKTDYLLGLTDKR